MKMTRFRHLMAGVLAPRPRALQAGALCLRRRDDGGREVLLITSLQTKRWIIPKGWPMRGRSLAGAAAREAWEEAGVRGRPHPVSIGCFSYAKQRRGGFVQRVNMQVFEIEVEGMDKTYPEAGRRKLLWLPPAEAAEKVSDPGLRTLLARI